MTSGSSQFARGAVRSLRLYAPDAPSCAIDLSDNTNLWGAPPSAVRAISEFASGVSRYPSLYSSHLRAAMLGYVGLVDAPDVSVVTGCGSDEVIDCVMRAFGAPGDRVSYCAPTFTMVPVFAQLNGLEPDPIPFAHDWDIDPERLVDRHAKVTYLCTPNNPTGSAASRAAIEYVVEHAEGIVLLDVAYAEFARDQFDDLVRTSDRLIVTHTFSKAFGLAGIRCGFGVGATTLVDLVTKARGPYKVNSLAERAAAAALQDSPDGVGWVREHATLAVANRVRLASALSDLGLRPLESDANFLLVPTLQGKAIFDGLCARGVLIRLMTGLGQDLPALAVSNGTALRIGIGPWDVMERLLTALREVL